MAYADTDQLARVLSIRSPSDEQEAALDTVLEAAAGEIDAWCDLAEGESFSAAWQLALLEQVNLERARELWMLREVQFGLVGLGSEFGATHIARDTFAKHAITLAPLKSQFGFA